MKTVTLSHGGGGKAMKDLIDEVFVAAFDNPLLAPLDDQARVPMSTLAQQGDRLAITTDSFVVDPLEFPGGDIGKLAVCGTINDLAVGGAIPLYLSCAAIIEEGLPFDVLHRIAAAGAPVIQVNTGTGCHLEADQVARGLNELRPGPRSILLIENVGNLVCPAMFDLGERAKVVILSVTEGDDKPLKYPHMFRAATLMLINKIDLLPHVDFDVARVTASARDVNPAITAICLSARTGEGMQQWYDWLQREWTVAAETAFA